jgi:hypothetical protein
MSLANFELDLQSGKEGEEYLRQHYPFLKLLDGYHGDLELENQKIEVKTSFVVTPEAVRAAYPKTPTILELEKSKRSLPTGPKTNTSLNLDPIFSPVCMFGEIISNSDYGSIGGPEKALYDNCRWYAYIYLHFNLVYWFATKTLVDRILSLRKIGYDPKVCSVFTMHKDGTIVETKGKNFRLDRFSDITYVQTLPDRKSLAEILGALK